MEQLPEDCVGHIFSFSSPVEACRLCPVSRATQQQMDSDTTWKKFLPSDYKEILSRLVYPIKYSSKKDLFFKLCNPLPIDNGRKMFWLDKRTGKKCYALGARELSFTGPNSPLYWSWKPLAPGSMFDEVIELRAVWYVEIKGRIRSSALSPNTTYRVYLIVKIVDGAYGLHKFPFEMTVENGKNKVQTIAFLAKHNNEKGHGPTIGQSNGTQYFLFGNNEGHRRIRMRKNGMLEIELGKFYNNGGGGKDEYVSMSLREVNGVHLKGGLIVEGMEIIAQI